MPEVTLAIIRAAAQRLADARRESTTRATALELDLAQAATPIYQRHREGIDLAAAEEAEARAELQALVDISPQLFQKPRSVLVDGVKCGYRKQEDGIEYDDEASVIARVRALTEFAELASVLIRSEEHLNASAIDQLDGNQRRRLGIRTVSGADQSFITYADTDVEKFVKAILADAAKRQGEDGAPKKPKMKRKEVA